MLVLHLIVSGIHHHLRHIATFTVWYIDKLLRRLFLTRVMSLELLGAGSAIDGHDLSTISDLRVSLLLTASAADFRQDTTAKAAENYCKRCAR